MLNLGWVLLGKWRGSRGFQYLQRRSRRLDAGSKLRRKIIKETNDADFGGGGPKLIQLGRPA